MNHHYTESVGNTPRNTTKYPTKLHQNPIGNLKIPSKPQNPIETLSNSHENFKEIWKILWNSPENLKISSILQAERFKGTGTWTLPSLRFAELEALLAALRVARSAELREVLMELVESWKNVEKTWENHGKTMGNCGEQPTVGGLVVSSCNYIWWLWLADKIRWIWGMVHHRNPIRNGGLTWLNHI